MNILNLRALAASLVLPALLGCGAPSAEQESDPAPDAAATTQEVESTVIQDDFETGSTEEWAEQAPNEAPASDDSGSDTEKE